MRETCCWNKRNGHSAHNTDCNSFGPLFGDATMVVTFMDGRVLRIPNVRFPLNTVATDPTIVKGTTVYTETLENPITLCGVRYFSLEH